MNCPHCNGRNPSDAKHCLHCAAPFEQPEAGFSGTLATEAGRIGWGQIATLLIVGFFATVMALKGFNTVEHRCARAPEEIAKFDAAPEWKRSASRERELRDQRFERDRDGRREHMWSHDDLEGVKCYERVTGKVKGLLDRGD